MDNVIPIDIPENAYICSVKMYVLTTPLSAGSKT